MGWGEWDGEPNSTKTDILWFEEEAILFWLASLGLLFTKMYSNKHVCKDSQIIQALL